MVTLHAPTDLDTVRAFLNTLDVDAGTDALGDGASFAAWLADAGLAPDGVAVDATGLARARDLRAALRELAAANHEASTDPAASHRLSELSAELDVRLRFTPDGGLELAGDGTDADAALAAIVAATAAAMADDRWRRVKLCGSDDCAWAFYDASRNRSGRWCSMAVCGNREKARSFRTRQAEGRR